MKLIFNIVKWIVGVILFIAIFGFAIKNMQDVALRFFGDYEMHGPLALLLFEFFIGGVVFGVIGMSYVVFRHLREVSKLKKTVAGLQKAAETQQQSHIQPPQPDMIVSKLQ